MLNGTTSCVTCLGCKEHLDRLEHLEAAVVLPIKITCHPNPALAVPKDLQDHQVYPDPQVVLVVMVALDPSVPLVALVPMVVLDQSDPSVQLDVPEPTVAPD